MKVTRCDALVLGSARPEAAVVFYRAIGVPLEEERHDDGTVHWACELGSGPPGEGLHFAVYPAGDGVASPRGSGGFTQLGLQVTSVDRAVAAARAAGASVLIEAEDVPWGRRAVVVDPDGRPVELNEAPGG